MNLEIILSIVIIVFIIGNILLGAFESEERQTERKIELLKQQAQKRGLYYLAKRVANELHNTADSQFNSDYLCSIYQDETIIVESCFTRKIKPYYEHETETVYVFIKNKDNIFSKQPVLEACLNNIYAYIPGKWEEHLKNLQSDAKIAEKLRKEKNRIKDNSQFGL